MSSAAIFRFAPSPTGELHIGHALSAMVGHDLARRWGGRFIVRIEDTDIGRSRPDFVDGIFRDLAWLELGWEEPVRYQSQCLAVYRTYQDRLVEMGLLYPCFATRSEIAAAAKRQSHGTDPDGAPRYPLLHKSLDRRVVEERKARGDAYALRLDMDRAIATAGEKLDGTSLTYPAFTPDGRQQRVAADPGRWGDTVIARKDTGTSYHIAGAVDDALQGITHVTRGQDLLAATDIHRLLQVLLDLPEPAYYHHALILDEDGRKLSKRDGDTSLRALRERGWTAGDVRERLRGMLP